MSQRKARVKKETKSGVDSQGKWLKKSGKLYYGYKKHIGVDKNKMILALHSVAANEHDRRGLKPLISKLGYTPPRKVYADKGYQLTANVSYFNSRGIKAVYRRKPIGTVH
ncbi:MAG: transposase [Flavobacteriales bacterium Tduv]